jgi:hypothetical protein
VVSLKFIEQLGEMEWFEEQPPGAKSPIDFTAFMARLKSRPDTKQSSLLERTQ